jgi:hypothetical protein
VTVVLVLAALLALAGWSRAVARCVREVRAGKAAARLRADAARQVELVRHRWDAHTDRLAAALEPLLEHLDSPAVAAVSGFGDAIVAEERVRTALASLTPPAHQEDPYR